MPTLRPASTRARHSARYARGSRWDVDPAAGTVSFTPARRSGQKAFTAVVGDGPGQVAQVLRLSGRFTYGEVMLGLDHYVLLDAAGEQVGTAVRRASPDTDPAQAWWPPHLLRPFLREAGVPLRDRVLGSARDLDAAFPGFYAQDRLNMPPTRWQRFITHMRA